MTRPHEIFMSARAALLAAVIALFLGVSPTLFAQSSLSDGWPLFWRPFDTSKPPATKGYKVLNIAVDISHPPFSYKDATGRITGFSVELARTICQTKGFTCRFEAVPWEEIQTRLLDGRAEVAVASLTINQKSREKFAFTNRYFLNPARFIALTSRGFKGSDSGTMSGKDIAVIEGTAHQAFLETYYKDADIALYKERDAALKDLKRDKVDAFFSDGVSLSYWMQSEQAAKCCSFIPGAYIESSYFGEGVGFSVSKTNAQLAKIFNYGLEDIRRRGTLERLYQVHFPISLY